MATISSTTTTTFMAQSGYTQCHEFTTMMRRVVVPGYGHTRKCSTSNLLLSTSYTCYIHSLRFREEPPLPFTAHTSIDRFNRHPSDAHTTKPHCCDRIAFPHSSQPPTPYRLLLRYEHANHHPYYCSPPTSDLNSISDSIEG